MPSAVQRMPVSGPGLCTYEPRHETIISSELRSRNRRCDPCTCTQLVIDVNLLSSGILVAPAVYMESALRLSLCHCCFRLDIPLPENNSALVALYIA